MTEVKTNFKSEKGLPHQPKSRESKEDKAWKQAVRKRDGHKCRRCGHFDLHNDAHHLATRKQRPDLVHVVSNGATVCRKCHNWIHNSPAKAKELGLLADETYEMARLMRGAEEA